METLHRERRLAPLERVLVEHGERAVLLPVGEIDWLEAQRNYVWLHVGTKVFRVRTPLGALESRLDPAKFVRVGRSTIVAVDRVAELLPTGNGDYEVRLTTGRRLVLSRRYRDRLEGFRV
jgi:two-component system LytT family response regulator